VFSDPDQHSTLTSTTILTGRENLTMFARWLGPGEPTDKKNQVNMNKKYRFMHITSLKQQGSGSVLNSQIRICIKEKGRILILSVSMSVMYVKGTFIYLS
jgi:hypothetical protein